MCEYCGCDAIPVIAELIAEHDAIREVARSARQAAAAGDESAAQLAVARLVELLDPHTRVEELGLFPALADEFGDHTASLVGEHRALDKAFLEFRGDRCATGWERRLVAALDALFEHILRERDGLFPAALSTLSPDQWDALDEVRAGLSASGGPAQRLG
jgi:hemerythrin-like domain-containing protein